MIEKKYQEILNTHSSVKDHLPIFRDYGSKCDHVTELGTGDGFSTWAFVASGAKVVSVDIVKPSDEELLKHIDFILADDLTIDIYETDLLFIDTHHTYGQLIKELTKHGNKSRKYILMHDTNVYGLVGNNNEEGLYKAISEFLMFNLHWQVETVYKNCGGLTILKRYV